MPRLNFCPKCGCRLDCHTGVNDAVPQEGDFSICIRCGQFLRYQGGELKATNMSEMVEAGLSLNSVAQLFMAKHYILAMKHERN
jgi:predicted nucleic-acid-binding Zn-ribbon protein